MPVALLVHGEKLEDSNPSQMIQSLVAEQGTLVPSFQPPETFYLRRSDPFPRDDSYSISPEETSVRVESVVQIMARSDATVASLAATTADRSSSISIGQGAAVIWAGTEQGLWFTRYTHLTSISSPRLPTEIEQRLSTLASLPANWDSYGAVQPSIRAVIAMRKVVEHVSGKMQHMPTPFITPGHSGGIGAEWRFQDKTELYVEVEYDGTLSYLLVTPRTDGGENETEAALQALGDLDAVLATIRS